MLRFLYFSAGFLYFEASFLYFETPLPALLDAGEVNCRPPPRPSPTRGGVTDAGLFGFVLSASVAVEQAFAVSGLGTALVQAFQERDLLVVQTLVLLYGVVFVVVNLLIDLAYMWVDPRIHYT